MSGWGNGVTTGQDAASTVEVMEWHEGLWRMWEDQDSRHGIDGAGYQFRVQPLGLDRIHELVMFPVRGEASTVLGSAE